MGSHEETLVQALLQDHNLVQNRISNVIIASVTKVGFVSIPQASLIRLSSNALDSDRS